MLRLPLAFGHLLGQHLDRPPAEIGDKVGRIVSSVAMRQ